MTSFDRSLPMILHRTLDAVMPEFRELFSAYNLTEQQWRVLRVLWISNKVTTAELASRTLLPSPSLVGIIDRLEKKNLVTRIRSEEDRRVVYVTATQEGRALEAEVTPRVADIDKSLRSCITQQEWLEMETTLAKIAAHTQTHDTNTQTPMSKSEK